MQLPLLPDRQKRFTVVEYPSNRQTAELLRVLLQSEGMPRGEKEGIVETRPGLTKADISEDLDTQAADLKAAEIVFKEPLPSGVEWEDLSQNALREAIGIFFGAGAATNGRRPNI